MSSKNVGKESIDGDRYYSPPWVTAQCINIVLPRIMRGYIPGRILEPSAGCGAFVDPLRRKYPDCDLHAVDFDDAVGPWEHASQSFNADFLTWESTLGYDLGVGNPPFGLSFEFVKKLVTMCDVVTLLLRQGFLASEDRREWLESSNLSHVFPLAHRPSFSGDGKTDSADYAFLCWRHGWTGPTELHLLPIVPLAARKSPADHVLSYNSTGKPVTMYHEKLF